MRKLKGWLDRLDRRLNGLSHGKKLAINLVLIVLFLNGIWIRQGCPLPTAEMEFRRMERTHLLNPSEIQGVFRDASENRWVVGTGPDQVVLFQPNRKEVGGTLSFWPKEGVGAALIPIPTWVSQFDREREIIAVNVPEGTASARLELTVGCWHQREDPSLSQMISSTQDIFDSEPFWWEQTCTADGELLEDGGVLFRVVSPDEHTDASVNIATVERTALGRVVNWDAYLSDANYCAINCHMEAVFYDGAGNELGRATLTAREPVEQ